MHIKRYFAPNMRQAMNAVRAAHGDDAVILSTNETSEGVEIVAALDPEALAYRENPEPHEPPISQFSAMPVESKNTHYEESLLAQAASNAQSAELQQMAKELQQVRSLLENQMSSLAWGQQASGNPEKVNLLKRLVEFGFGWELAQELVAQAERDGHLEWSSILALLEQEITTEEQDILDKGGVIALVGPTGVGKTTTIAKLASRFVMRNGTEDIALITTDSYKIGAQAQLKLFAELIQVPVHVAATQSELYRLLTSLATKKLVLIDTAGMSQKDLQLSRQLTSGEVGVNMIRNYLVMSAGTQLNVMRDIVRSFGEVGLKGCILTKLDEATQLGNVLTVLLESNLSVNYLTTGQRVPEDLENIRPRDLIDRAIVLGQQNKIHFDEQSFRLGMAKEISNAQ